MPVTAEVVLTKKSEVDSGSNVQGRKTSVTDDQASVAGQRWWSSSRSGMMDYSHTGRRATRSSRHQQHFDSSQKDERGTSRFNIGKLALAMLIAVLIVAVPMALQDSSSLDADGTSDNVEIMFMAEPATYEVHVTAKDLTGVTGGGTVKINDRTESTEDTESFSYGTEVTLTAIPATGYVFMKWESGATQILDNATTITVTDNCDYVAVFAKKYVLTGGGTSFITPDGVKYGIWTVKGSTLISAILVSHPMEEGEEVTMADEVTYEGVTLKIKAIGNEAFKDKDDKKVTEVTISKHVEEVNRWAFNGATALKSILVASGNEKYSSMDGVLFDAEKYNIIRFPEGKEGTYIMPDSVKEMNQNAFDSCTKLTAVEMPSVTYIKSDTFIKCTLNSMTMLASVGMQGGTTVSNFKESKIETLTLIGDGAISSKIRETMESWKLPGMTETIGTIVMNTSSTFTLPDIAEIDGKSIQFTDIAVNISAGNNEFYETDLKEELLTGSSLAEKTFKYMDEHNAWIGALTHKVSLAEGNNVSISSINAIVGSDAVVALIASEHYEVPDSVDVYIEGELLDLSEYTYDKGLITIPAAVATDDIVIIEITAIGVPKKYGITFTGDGTASDLEGNEKVSYGTEKKVIIELVDTDRALPSKVTVKVDGTEMSEAQYEYNPAKGASTATLTIYGSSITGSILIIADAESIPEDSDDMVLYAAVAIVAIIAVLVVLFLVMKRNE